MDRPGGAAGLSRGSLGHAVGSPRSLRLRTDPRCSRQEAAEALTSSRVIPLPSMIWSTTPVASALSRRERQSRYGVPAACNCPQFPHPRSRHPEGVIPCGTTTFKQLSRLDTDPAVLLHPVSDVCLLPPAGFTTGLVASLCPWKDFHLLDNLNWFHRGSHPQIPTVTSLARHDTPWFGGVLVDTPGLSTLRNRSHPLVVTALPYAVGAGLPANAGITSSVKRRRERSVCSWGKVPQANAQIT